MKKSITLMLFLCIAYVSHAQLTTGYEPLDLNRLGDKSAIIDPAVDRVGVAAPIALTGAILISRLKKAITGILEQADAVGADLANQIAADLTNLEANLNTTLENNLQRPITELNQTIQESVQRAVVMIDQVQNFADVTRTCARSDLRLLANGLLDHLHQLRSDILPWKAYPVVTNIYERGARVPYGLIEGRPALLVLEGYDLESSAKCSKKYTVEIFNQNNNKLKATITGIGKNAITVAIEAPSVPGAYTIRIDVYKKSFMGCKKATITNSIAVIRKAGIKIKYQLTPTCVRDETIEFKAGELHLTNDRCDGDKYAGETYSLPPGFQLTGFQFINNSQNGCTYSDPIRQIGNNSVTLRWTCPEKGGVFCSGARKWIHGVVMMYGKRPVEQAGQPIIAEYNAEVEFGQTVEVLRLGDAGCDANGWTVAVTVIYPDGSEHHIPAQGSADANGTIAGSNHEGAAFYWNGLIRSLSVSTPALSCTL